MPRKPAQSKIAATAAPATRAAPGEIVVYQPDETLRLDVRVENETVWLTQEQMCSLFDRDQSVIARHIRNAFGEGEVDAANNMQILHNNRRGQPLRVYSLDDKELYLVGASLKDLGSRCFAFSKMDASAIPDIKSRI